jgi:tetratricopeptide (TPR) repeat protein
MGRRMDLKYTLCILVLLMSTQLIWANDKEADRKSVLDSISNQDRIRDLVERESYDEVFELANKAYQNEFYKEAQSLYAQIEDAGYASAELYYNLGNCFSKMKALAPSIYYYEKALKLNPGLRDAQINLELANRNTIDDIQTLPQTLLQRLDSTYLKAFSVHTWAWISLAFSLLFGASFLAFHFSLSPGKRRLFFVSSFLSAGLLIIALLIVFKENNELINRRDAVLFDLETQVRNAPSDKAEVDFTLHEGTVMQVVDEVDMWRKIKLVDGSEGWLKQESIKEY